MARMLQSARSRASSPPVDMRTKNLRWGQALQAPVGERCCAELVIDLKTAMALGIKVSRSLPVSADEVIQ